MPFNRSLSALAISQQSSVESYDWRKLSRDVRVKEVLSW